MEPKMKQNDYMLDNGLKTGSKVINLYAERLNERLIKFTT